MTRNVLIGKWSAATYARPVATGRNIRGRLTPSGLIPGCFFNRDGLSVAVVENGLVHIRNITPVRDFGTSVEVSAGVAAGDNVILDPQVDLADGRKVTAIGADAARPARS
jgi:hypothetical protein